MRFENNKDNFDYFDQFKTLEIDLSEYIEFFSTEKNKISFSNFQPVKVHILDFFGKYKLTFENFSESGYGFIDYKISDDEKPLETSLNIFGSTDFWWLILVVNGIQNPMTGWPISEERLSEIAKFLYENEAKYSQQFYYNVIHDKNEKLRNIIVPTPTTLGKIINEYTRLVSEQ